MKKALSILTAGCLAVSLAACGSTAASSAASAADSTASSAAESTAKAQGAVYRQVGNIQDAEGKVNANRHNGPNQALRQCARHGIEQCCNVQEIVNSSKKI